MIEDASLVGSKLFLCLGIRNMPNVTGEKDFRIKFEDLLYGSFDVHGKQYKAFNLICQVK